MIKGRIVWWLLVTNIFLSVGHLILEPMRGDLNWARLGQRSGPSSLYMLIEGVAALTLFLFVFLHFYPKMSKLFSSRLTLLSACVLGAEICIWFKIK